MPGTKGLEHRIGGLEKEDVTGRVTYDAENHARMVELRARKIAGIAEDIPPASVSGPEFGPLLVVGWAAPTGRSPWPSPNYSAKAGRFRISIFAT